MDNVLEELTKLLIKEHIEGDKQVFQMTKEDLIKFSIKLVKVIGNNTQ